MTLARQKTYPMCIFGDTSVGFYAFWFPVVGDDSGRNKQLNARAIDYTRTPRVVGVAVVLGQRLIDCKKPLIRDG